jgi:hypothetical protein
MDDLAITKSSDSPYTVLDEASQEIRLLELLPGEHDSDIVMNLHVKAPQEGLRYITLSYVWGKERCPRLVQVNGKHLTIGRNLDCALRHIRDNTTDLLAGTTMLWVDALCIDQTDVQERSHQVRIMGQIYASAIDMVIWLGPEREDTTFILAKIRGGELPEGTEVVLVLKALKRLCRRPWFGRLWIAQELALSADPNVLVGHQSLRWNCFHDFVSRIDDRATAMRGTESKWWPYYACEYFQRASRRILNLGIIKGGVDASLQDRLKVTTSLLASDPRDKVYGLLNICKFACDHVGIKPDYTKSVRRVFAEVTYAMLLEDFCPYAVFALQPQYSDVTRRAMVPTRITGLPSWVLDLTIDTKQPFFFLGSPGRPSRFLESRAFYSMSLSWKCGLQAHIKVDEELTRLSVIGNYLGTIVETTGSTFDTQGDDYHYATVITPRVLHDAYLMIAKPRHIPIEVFIQAIMGGHDGSSEDEAALVQIVQESISTQDTFMLGGQHTFHIDNVVFVTAEGQVGRAYHPDFENGIRAGDIVVGLFGINYPFILRKVPAENGEETVYTMVNVAYITGHEWGHDFVKSAPDDEEWPDIEKYGLQRYTIV